MGNSSVVRAVRIERHGGPEVLQLRWISEPVAGPGEVLIRMVASSINPVDWKTRAWEMGPPLPATLGWDVSGVVVDSADAGYRAGDRVVAMTAQVATGRGAWADLVALPAHLVAPAPATVSLAEAAILPLAGLTAAQALHKIRLGSGDRLLVTGAAGGVGGLAVQLARGQSATVDGLASRPEHVAAARELGAELVAQVPEELSPRRYQAVLDTAGVDVTHALAPGGRYVSIADVPLPAIPGAAKSYVQEDGKQLTELGKLVDAGILVLRMGAHYPLRAVREAHEHFERGGLLGKVVLTF